VKTGIKPAKLATYNSPQRKLWVRSSIKPKARVAGDIDFFVPLPEISRSRYQAKEFCRQNHAHLYGDLALIGSSQQLAASS